MDLPRKLAAFALVSGTGLAVDFALFVLLTHQGTATYSANLVSGGCAVTFVYFASVQKIFAYQGRFLFGLFAVYVAYQVAGVTLASLAVSALARDMLPALLAKLAILPVTFGANFLFMALLTRQGAAARRGAGA